MAGELFIDIFTDISMRKKHGWLKVALPSRVLEIGLIEGRIQSIDVPGFSLAKRVLSRLVRAGIVPVKVEKTVGAAGVTVSIPQLLAALEAKKYATKKQFLAALRAEAWDLLLSLRFVDDAQCDFEPAAIRSDGIFPLELNPGHVLLEIIEFENSEPVLAELIGGSPEISPSYIVAEDEPGRRLLGHEQCVLDCVGDGISVRELFSNTLLNVAEITYAVQSLIEFGALRLISSEEFEARWALNKVTEAATEPEQESAKSKSLRVEKSTNTVAQGMIDARVGGAVDEVVKTAQAVSSLVTSEIWGRGSASDILNADSLPTGLPDPSGSGGEVLSEAGLWEENSKTEVPADLTIVAPIQKLGDKFCFTDNLNVFAVVVFLGALSVFVPPVVDNFFRALQEMGLGQ